MAVDPYYEMAVFRDADLEALRANLVSAYGFQCLTAGVTRYDYMRRNPLSDTGNVAISSDRPSNFSGYSLDFSTDYVSITDAAQDGLDITGAMTISCWAKMDSNTSSAYIVGKYDSGSSNCSYLLYKRYSGGTYTFRFYVSVDGIGANTVWVESASVSINTWYHIVCRYIPSTEISIFVNGTEYVETTGIPASLYNGSADFIVGAGKSSGTPTAYFDGHVFALYIWNTDLSDTLVDKLYTNPNPLIRPDVRQMWLFRGFWLDSTIEAYADYLQAGWRMEEGGGRRTDSGGGYLYLDVKSGSVGQTTGKKGYAALFNGGSANHLYKASTAYLKFATDPFTFSFWIKAAHPGGALWIGGTYASGNGEFLYLLNTDGTIRFRVYTDGVSYVEFTSTDAIKDDDWSHVVLRFTPSTEMAIFIDGEKSIYTTSIPATIFSGTADFTIGGYSTAASLVGAMDEFFIWRAALSDAACEALYNDGSGVSFERPYRFGDATIQQHDQYFDRGYKLDVQNGWRHDPISYNFLYRGAANLEPGSAVGLDDYAVQTNRTAGSVRLYQPGYSYADGQSKVTISCWFKQDEIGYNGLIVGDVGTGTVEKCSVGIDSTNKLRVRIYDNAQRNFQSVSTLTDTASYHHLVLAVDTENQTVKAWIDNTLWIDDTGTLSGSSITTDTNEVLVGSGYFVGGFYYKTQEIDEIYIWHEAFTATEVSALYNSGVGKFILRFEGQQESQLSISRDIKTFHLSALDAERDWVRELRESQLIAERGIYRTIESYLISERDWLRSLRESQLIAERDIFKYVESEIIADRYIRAMKTSENIFEREYLVLQQSLLNAERNIYTWHYSDVDSDRAYRVFKPSDLDMLRSWRQFIEVGSGPGAGFARHHFTVYGADVYIDGVWKGFIDFDDGEDTLPNIPVPDGDHTVEIRMSKWFWPQCRTTKRSYFTVTGGELQPAQVIPAVANLAAEIVRANVVLTWNADWNDEFTEPSFTGFGLWTSPTTPVNISGAPLTTISYSGTEALYQTSYSGVAADHYAAIAGYLGSERGTSQEVFVDFWTTAPISPLNQRLDEME